MPRLPDRSLLAVALLAFSQGCGSCGGGSTPQDQSATPAPTLGNTGKKLLKTTTTETHGFSLDGKAPESVLHEAGAH